jgi:hypothetical protein
MENLVKRFPFVVAMLLGVSASSGHALEPANPKAKTICLEIPDTGQEKRRPESGWCGEAAIQMALSYYGGYASQRAINRAGKPVHPDLYANGRQQCYGYCKVGRIIFVRPFFVLPALGVEISHSAFNDAPRVTETTLGIRGDPINVGLIRTARMESCRSGF